jgi:hypothetical protein
VDSAHQGTFFDQSTDTASARIGLVVNDEKTFVQLYVQYVYASTLRNWVSCTKFSKVTLRDGYKVNVSRPNRQLDVFEFSQGQGNE